MDRSAAIRKLHFVIIIWNAIDQFSFHKISTNLYLLINPCAAGTV